MIANEKKITTGRINKNNQLQITILPLTTNKIMSHRSNRETRFKKFGSSDELQIAQ